VFSFEFKIQTGPSKSQMGANLKLKSPLHGGLDHKAPNRFGPRFASADRMVRTASIRHPQRQIWPIGWTTCAILAVLGMGCGTISSETKTNERHVILKIGYREFDIDQFNFFFEKTYPELKGTRDDELASVAFDRFKRDMIIAECARNIGLRVTESQIDDFINQQMTQMTFNLLPPEEQAKWRREIEHRLVIQQFLKREILQRVDVSDEVIASYYQDHQDEFVRPEQYRIRQAQITTQEKAEEFRKKLRSTKESFTKLAAEYSENEGYRLAPPIELQHLPDGFRQALKKMRPGQYSKVIPVTYGELTYYHVLYLESKLPQLQISFEDAYPMIKKNLEREAVRELLKTRIDRFTRNIPIKVFYDHLNMEYIEPEKRGNPT